MAEAELNNNDPTGQSEPPLYPEATSPGGDTFAGEVDQLRGELEAAGDLLLRARAELENVRKRARRELEDELRYANLPLLRDVLQVADNLQRAIRAAEGNAEAGTLLEGVKMVAQSLDATLARWQCRRIEALHKPFDPAFHEAIAQQPSNEFPPQTVLAVVLDGFMLHERVVRPAQVVVAAAPQPASTS